MKAKEKPLVKSREIAMSPDVIETRTGRVTMDDSGIVRAEVNPKSNQSIIDAKENVASVIKIANGRKVPLLVDLRGIRHMNRDARMYYSGEETKKIAIAVALLVTSPISKIVGNFFLGPNKARYPMKLFTSEDEARNWLKGFLR